MTDPKPLTPEEFERWKDTAQNAGEARMYATIEAAWDEVKYLKEISEKILDPEYMKTMTESVIVVQAVKDLKAAILRAKKSEAEKDAALKKLSEHDDAGCWLDAWQKSEAALSDANLRYTKAVTELQAEVAALKQSVEAAKGLNILHDEQVRRLEQERDKALAEVERLNARGGKGAGMWKPRALEAEEQVQAHEARYQAAVESYEREFAKVRDAFAAQTVEHRALKEDLDKALADLAKAERTMGVCSGPCHGERGQEYMDALDKALADAARMREALKFYARRHEDSPPWDNWMRINVDRYDNAMTFDWPGEEANEPWEPAEAALSSSPDDWLKRHDAEVRAGVWMKAADRCEQRAKDAAMESMPAVLYGELQSRALYFRERAAEERKHA